MTAQVITIRDQIATTVTGLTTTGSSVYKARVYPLKRDSDLPALLIYVGESEIINRNVEGGLEWVTEFKIEAIVTSTSDLDSALFTVVEEVAEALSDFTLDGTAKHALMTEISEPELTGEGEQPVGQIVMTVAVTYDTTRANI